MISLIANLLTAIGVLSHFFHSWARHSSCCTKECQLTSESAPPLRGSALSV